MKLKDEIFLQSNTKFFSLEVADLPNFGSCQYYVDTMNTVAEIPSKLSNEKTFSNREPCTCCEYVTMPQSFQEAHQVYNGTYQNL